MDQSGDMEQLEERLQAVLVLARQAGAAIMQLYTGDDKRWEVTHKADNSLLTQADLAAHLVLVAGLQQLTPDIPVVSEEDVASQQVRHSSARFWLIDPLDGTKEFVARNGEFTVNIALIEQGRPVLGVVFAPALDAAYMGGSGMGAFRELQGVRTPIHVASAGNVVRVVASKSHLNTETEQFIARLGVHELVQAGSSLKFCRVAEGSADIYPRLAPTCEWDTAAAQAVLEAAGGVVTDLQGAPLVYGKADVLNPSFIAASRLLTGSIFA